MNINLYVPNSEVFDPENKPYLHPRLVCQILHDLFGIIAIPVTHVYLNTNLMNEKGKPDEKKNSSDINDDNLVMVMNLP